MEAVEPIALPPARPTSPVTFVDVHRVFPVGVSSPMAWVSVSPRNPPVGGVSSRTVLASAATGRPVTPVTVQRVVPVAVSTAVTVGVGGAVMAVLLGWASV